MDINEFNTLRQANPFTPLGELIYQRLREDIIQVRILPGTKLNESRLAQDMGVSRTPIRNTLARLAEENLVRKKDARICVVSPMTKEEAHLLFEARISIEGHAAALSADRISAEQLSRLECLINQYAEIAKNLDASGYAACDHDFHRVIIESAQNAYISAMYGMIKNRLRHYRHYLLYKLGRDGLQPILCQAAKYHKTIYTALKFGFAEMARLEMERDIAGMMAVFSKWR